MKKNINLFLPEKLFNKWFDFFFYFCHAYSLFIFDNLFLLKRKPEGVQELYNEYNNVVVTSERRLDQRKVERAEVELHYRSLGIAYIRSSIREDISHFFCIFITNHFTMLNRGLRDLVFIIF